DHKPVVGQGGTIFHTRGTTQRQSDAEAATPQGCRAHQRELRRTAIGSSSDHTQVANSRSIISISKKHIVKSVECTAALFNPVISSICCPYDCAPFTNTLSFICI